MFNINSNVWLPTFSLILICVCLSATTGCDQKKDAVHQPVASNQLPAVNAFGARQLDPDVVKAEIETAWNNYLSSLNIEPPSKPIGLSEKEIAFIETETRQKLPEDLKAFLRIYLANGSTFHDRFDIFSAEEIVDWWKFLTDLNYVQGANGEPLSGFPDPNSSPTWFEPFLIPLMHYDVIEIHFDIRTGNLIESLDGPCGVLAGSLSEMLNELATHHRAGRRIGGYSFDGKEVGPFLNSRLWVIYEK